MKKTLSIIVVLLLSITVMTGCSNNQSQTPSQPSQETEQTQQTPTAQIQQAPSQNTVDTSNFIGEEKAKEIALQRAGITAENVTFDRTELDFDDGVWKYEIEFRQGRNEYDADIKADDGTIISFETDYDD